MVHNPELDLAFDFVQNTNRNIFLTGKAGTGKTTFLHKLKEFLPKRMVVVAPTGVAAINARGVTIHSFFQMPFGPILPESLSSQESKPGQNPYVKKFNKKKINIIRTLDLLVIDEISMVRADLLDGIDQVLRRYKNSNLPFGGTQVLVIGDLQQLAPIVKDNEWSLLKDYYDTVYFFSSKVFQQGQFLGIELKHIYRQQDNKFIKILNEIRDNKLTPESLEILNARYISGFTPKAGEGYITLTTHNATANRINEKQLDLVNSKTHTFEAEVKDNFPEYSFPTDKSLKLKKGAQVMFVKNDSSPEKRYFNGKIGMITGFSGEIINVQCPEEDEPIAVTQETWENIRYSIDEKTKAIEEETMGSFIQHPLRLAWAITIHKSQGLTFEKAVIDAQAAFAHGQTYVALSRCKTLEGLVLHSPLSNQAIISDRTVGAFNQQVHDNPPDENTLTHSKRQYVLNLLDELFSYKQISYHLNKGLKQSYTNETVIHGNFQSPLKKMYQDGSLVLDEVAQKFAKQLRYIAETSDNKNFQERIKKGSTYFLEQTKLLLSKPLEEISYETDNSKIKKSIRESLSKINELIHVKLSCLKYTERGFEIKGYLKTRATAALEKAGTSTGTGKQKEEPLISQNPILYSRLRKWRNALAEEENMPIYYIMSQKAIIGISNELPVIPEQLMIVKGIGKKKAEEYGDIILEMVKTYCSENKIEPRKDIPEKKKRNAEKTPTKEITKSLWDKGKSIDEIAKDRSLVKSTIEGHIAYYVGTGELDVGKFVDDDKIKAIMAIVEKKPDAGMADVKEKLGESVSWSDLKFIFQHLNFMKKDKV